MDSTLEVTKQDIVAARDALKARDFRLARIMGNRLMSNALIGERKDLMILGYLTREVASEFAGVRFRDVDRLPECEKTGWEFLDQLISMIDSGKVDPDKVWDIYCKYENEIRKNLPTDIERDVYKENMDFSRKASSMLSMYLRDNMELLLDERNQLLGGILGEVSRIINVHGVEKPTLVFYLLTKALAEYYKYAIFSEMRDGTVEDRESLKSRIYPHAKKIVDLCSAPDSSDLYSGAVEILGELGSEWRSYFIKYGELTIPSEMIVERKPRVEIPEEAKRKIGDTIAEAIEKEVKK